VQGELLDATERATRHRVKKALDEAPFFSSIYVVYDVSYATEFAMNLNVNLWMRFAWGAVAVEWLAGLAFTKPTIRSQAKGARLFHLALA